MKKQRIRTATLTLRLTPEEKALLRQRASVRRLTLTDYILRAALEHSDAKPYGTLLKELGDLRATLKSLQQKEDADAFRDMLAETEKTCGTILSAIARVCGL